MSTADPTEPLRRQLVGEINNRPKSREELEEIFPGEVYDTDQLTEAFEVVSFLAPFCSVVRRSDRRKGVLMSQHDSRFYFAFRPTDCPDA